MSYAILFLHSVFLLLLGPIYEHYIKEFFLLFLASSVFDHEFGCFLTRACRLSLGTSWKPQRNHEVGRLDKSISIVFVESFS
jgi:hypothetical protein